MSFPHRIDAVVFDMDGLLIDSEALYYEALLAELLALGLTPKPEDIKATIGLSWTGAAEVLSERCASTVEASLLRENTLKRFYALSAGGVRLKAGVTEILECLERLALPAAICTSSHRAQVDHHLSAHNMASRFGAIIANGDYVRAKPDREPYLKSAEALGVDPRNCLALEDSYNGVRAASAAGMMTIMVPDLLRPDEEMRSKCVHIVESLHKVVELLTIGQFR